MLGVLVVAGLALGGCAGEVTGTPTAGGSGGSATSSRSEPFEGRLLKPNEVVKADKLDGVALQPITDGVLRNYGTTLTVLEVGTSDVIEGASESDQEDLGADEGSTLLAFRVRVEAPGDSVSDKVTGSVTVDGVSRSLPEFSTVLGSYSKDDSTLQYIVPVPDNRRSVELELKYANLSQKFDLLEGRRVGEAPVVLYRSKSGPDLVNESLTPSQVSVAAMPGSDGEQESYALSGPKATLSFFSPANAGVASAPDKAWLAVTYLPTASGASYAKSCVATAADFTVTDDKGGTFQAQDSQSKIEKYDSQRIAFEVPGDLKKAKLTFAPKTMNCDYSGYPAQWTISGAATIDIAFTEG